MTVRKKKIDETAEFWITYGIDLKKRRIYLDEEVDEFSMGWINRAIMLMVDLDDKAPIEVYINCFGGSVYDGLGLYDILSNINVPIHTYCVGSAMSMALLLFLAGDVRVATPNSTFMAHSLSAGMGGKLSEMKVDMKESERLHKVLVKILADNTLKSEKWWEAEIKHEDKYYDVKRAKELGIIIEEE